VFFKTVPFYSAAGLPRLLSPLFDTATGSKVAIVRRSSIEYLSLAAATWPSDSIEKSAKFFNSRLDMFSPKIFSPSNFRFLPTFKQTIKVGTTDADPVARKAARQLFWVLLNRPIWSSTMESFLLDLELSSQKYHFIIIIIIIKN